MTYTLEQLTEILDFVLNEDSVINTPPAILDTYPHFWRVREILEFAKGYDDKKNYPTLTELAERVVDLNTRVVAVEAQAKPDGALDTRIKAIEAETKPGGTLEARVADIEKASQPPPESVLGSIDLGAIHNHHR